MCYKYLWRIPVFIIYLTFTWHIFLYIVYIIWYGLMSFHLCNIPINLWDPLYYPKPTKPALRLGRGLIFTVYPKKYAHGFVVLCFVVVMQSFIMNSHEVFIHFHQGCFAGTGAILRLPQCQWSKPDGYGKTSQCITTTKHSKAKTVCIFLGIYCTLKNIGITHPFYI